MSLAEIKEEVTRLTSDERAELAAHLATIEKADSASWQEEIARRLDASQAGQHTSLDELVIALNARVAEEP